MSVLVTGGTGCLGYHLLSIMTKTKGRLISYSLETPKPYRFHKHVEYYQGDIQDKEKLLRILSDHRPDEIFHLAAQNSVGFSQIRPRLTLGTNILGTQTILECARKTVPKARVVLISSSEVYGGGKGISSIIHSETDPVTPMTSFATSKAACELLARQYAKVHKMDIFIVRPFHFAGPYQSIRFVLPAVAKQLAEIILFDGELAVYAGNLDISRDYLDVRDMVRGISLLSNQGEAGEIYNICSGKTFTIRELINIMVANTGKPIDIRIDPTLERQVDIPLLAGSPDKMINITGWKPIISLDDTLSDILSEMKRRVKAARGQDDYPI